MELIDQRTKKIMEGCKQRARDAGLRFQNETLEYIVTNKDLLELSPKYMIPTLYDYWVHDVEVLKEKGRYELYPNNPYETVINTRPPISFYNDNNPDWLNVMIFYHVLAHIDFFQNNMMFKHTWNEDFEGQALSDKRFISLLRAEKGHMVDYVIEFTRGIDNLVGYYEELAKQHGTSQTKPRNRVDYYFDVFLQGEKKARLSDYLKEIERYNDCVRRFASVADSVFFADVAQKHPEFEAFFEKSFRAERVTPKDLIQFIQEHSPFLNKEENKWMKSVMEIVRKTSLFFQPQIRTKILNEGWASYWHEILFLKDDRIKGNEVSFARVNAKVTALPRVGLNPYALGMRLFQHVEELADKGKLSYDFQRIRNVNLRQSYDMKIGSGSEFVFKVREDYNDFMFINNFVDQDFVTRNDLFVAEKRMNGQKGVWEYYVKSRKADDYKEMLVDSLYHPPCVEIDINKSTDSCLYLNHRFEGKGLVPEFVSNTLLGVEYLLGYPVKLETHEAIETGHEKNGTGFHAAPLAAEKDQFREKAKKFRRVLYTMENRKLSKSTL